MGRRCILGIGVAARYGLDEDEFAQQVEAAIGMLWYQEAIACGAEIDVIEVSPS